MDRTARSWKLNTRTIKPDAAGKPRKTAFEGLLDMLYCWYEDTSSNQVRDWVESFYNYSFLAKVRKGGRLRKESLSIRLEDSKTGKDNLNIHDVVSLSISQAKQFFDNLALSSRDEEIAHQVLKEIRQRLDFLLNVGSELSYTQSCCTDTRWR